MNKEQFEAMMPRYTEAIESMEKAFTAKVKAKLAGVPPDEQAKLDSAHYEAVKRFELLKEEIQRFAR